MIVGRPLDIVTTAEMAEADRLAAASGIPGATLMDRAGQAVAAAADRMLANLDGRRVLVLCGPGNNGGDGFVAATTLARRGYDVTVAALRPGPRPGGDAAAAAAAWTSPTHDAASAVPASHDLVVDALFGAGLSRPLDGAGSDLVARVNACGRPVLAVDLPSGLSGDDGTPLGAAIRATETVTFFRLKPGHLLMPGREHCGRVTLADIGLDPAVLPGLGVKLFHNVPGLWWSRYPSPVVGGHKYARGHLVVVSGPMPTLGAARLTARGGLRVGAGLVTLLCPEDALAAHAAQLTAVMVRPFTQASALAEVLTDARLNAVALGPGLGHHGDTDALVGAAMAPGQQPRAAVLDADALTLFAGRPDDLARLVANRSGPTVVTPHDGEFERLFAGCGDVLGAASKVERARAGAERLGAVLVLKGPDTVVAAPDGRAAIAGEDAPWLATAGSGDVLCGLVAGLLAQSMPAFEAAAAAVWLHAEAARRFGPGLIAEDLSETLPAVLKELFAHGG